MDHFRPGDRPSRTPSPDNFTGRVRMEPLVTGVADGETAAIHVTFEPGARTHWHAHPRGQVLIVTAGCGRAQTEGQPPVVLRPGDVVRFAPGERHWHGAAPETGLSHIAIQQPEGGETADWMDPVSDADFAADPA
ncbi:cupin domain-containing protein [Jannaschia sp. Os4]|uniref:(R)-mandelonitrile lyase n=1 Tax=Jannaschia sp. Os4 TaxID=2807617 RepID=UPI00193A1E48|nr:cupin domain-containing protein [Jannaschia sp. Os4]MBM2576636.1 cupin domain-containing protein [Jannaschia sp. Os4]